MSVCQARTREFSEGFLTSEGQLSMVKIDPFPYLLEGFFRLMVEGAPSSLGPLIGMYILPAAELSRGIFSIPCSSTAMVSEFSATRYFANQ